MLAADWAAAPARPLAINRNDWDHVSAVLQDKNKLQYLALTQVAINNGAVTDEAQVSVSPSSGCSSAGQAAQSQEPNLLCTGCVFTCCAFWYTPAVVCCQGANLCGWWVRSSNT